MVISAAAPDIGISPSDLKRIKNTLSSDKAFIETWLKIQTKESRNTAFRLNPLQEIVISSDQRRKVELKARQQGMSTGLLAQRLKRVMTRENWTAVTIAQDDPTTEMLFQRVQFFYKNLPDALKLPTKYNSRRELYFPEINSRYMIYTAGGNRGPGRGTTVNDIHGSEVSRWPDAEEIIGGLLETAPKDAYIDLESTANGASGYFYELYNEAKSGHSSYKPFFFPWWVSPEYKLNQEEAAQYGVNPLQDWNEEERDLSIRHSLTAEQLYWRRWKKRDLRQLFDQEYPEDDVTCFLTSGNMFFDRETLERAKRAGELQPARTEKDGRLLFWKEPNPDLPYLISADVAEGIATGDYSAAYVMDGSTGETVAALHGHWNPHSYALELANLGERFNYAQLAVERNNHGHAVLTTLIYELGYSNIYTHKDYDSSGNSIEKPGFPTTSKTRPIALGALRQGLEDAPSDFPDPSLFAECWTFVENENGKAEAGSGAHDDRVMAAAIGRYIWLSFKQPSSRRVGSTLILSGKGY